MMAGLALAMVLQGAEILAVRCDVVPGGAAVKVLASAPFAAKFEREGDQVRVTLQAERPAGLELPAPQPPLLALAAETGSSSLVLRLTLAAGAAFEPRQEGSLVTLSVTNAAAAPSRDVEQLYPLLFPGWLDEAPAPPEPASAVAESGGSGRLTFGPFTLRPTLVVRYVDATSSFLDTPTPVRARYFEFGPTIGIVSSELAYGARLALNYQPQFRRPTDDAIPILSQPSHFVNASLDVPLGSSGWLSISDQYGRGTIETQMVDPGREYFYDIGRFQRNQVSVLLRTEMAGRLDFDMGGSLAKETLESGAGYFDNDREGVFAGLRYELARSLRSTLRYSLDRVPPQEQRPLVEMTGHMLSVGLEGDLTPLVKANLQVGYRSETYPLALAPGDHYSGLMLGATLSRQFNDGGSLTLGGLRTTNLSAFDANAFFVTSGASLSLNQPLPLGVRLTGGVSHQWNDYRQVDASLGVPRADRILGWTAGVGRTLTRWSYLRADYTQEQRKSNLGEFNTRSHSLIIQLGIGVSGGR